jgi:hypothetical protein
LIGTRQEVRRAVAIRYQILEEAVDSDAWDLAYELARVVDAAAWIDAADIPLGELHVRLVGSGPKTGVEVLRGKLIATEWDRKRAALQDHPGDER